MGLFSWLQDTVKKVVSQVAGGEDDAASTSQPQTPVYSGVFVRTRRGSMFIDGDGDMAHEFYEERFGTLWRITEGLEPQGQILLDKPCLGGHLPIVLCKADDVVTATTKARDD
eukprot:m.16120 g.16120  ORF g.16120 m.16120 type:complete len:113 (+) comp5164_c1_seq1:168-506(+)